MRRPRVLLADDHPPLLAAIRRLLAEEFEVVGEASDGAEAVRLARALQPDVVIMDLAMPPLGGMEAIRQLQADPSGPAVLALTVISDSAVRRAALEAGASGYVLKSQAGCDLIPAIRAALHDDTVLHFRLRAEDRQDE
jgi:DNA-binding NarL/FixJ family response regulator